MDPDNSPLSRAGRTLWTVWSYVTEAVSRFLRPEPTNTVSDDPKPFQASAVDSDHPEAETSRGGVDEVAPASLLSSSRPVVAWELCTTEIDLGPEDERVLRRSQLSGGGNGQASEESEGAREEQLGQTGNDDARLLVMKDAGKEKEEAKDSEVEIRDQELFLHGQGEKPENLGCEEWAKRALLHLEDGAMSEDMEGSGSTATLDHSQIIDETMRESQVKEEENKMHQDLEAEDTEITCPLTDCRLEEEQEARDETVAAAAAAVVAAVTYEEVESSDGVSQQASENDNQHDEEAKQVENRFSFGEGLSGSARDFQGDPGLASLGDELQATLEKGGNLPDDVGQEHVAAHRRESDEVEDEGEEEDENGGEENADEAADNQAAEEEDVKIVPEDSQAEDILTEHVARSGEVVLGVKPEPHTAELAAEDKEDVAEDTGVQTKTSETEDADDGASDDKSITTPTDMSAGERRFDEGPVEEEGLSREKENSGGGYMEESCSGTSFPVKPEGESGQEVGEAFKNVPPGTWEGRAVVSPELNSPTCEETREGVPEYNNEPGPDENAAQGFLEAGEGEGVEATQLPEEVGSTEPGSLRNAGAGRGYLVARERVEEEPESAEALRTERAEEPQLPVTGSAPGTGKPLADPEGSRDSFEGEGGKSSDSSMKAGVEHPEKELEAHVGVGDAVETGDGTTDEARDEAEEPLFDFEADEGLSGSRDAAGPVLEATGAVAAEGSPAGVATEVSFFQELADVTDAGQKCNVTRSSLEDLTDPGSAPRSVGTEPRSPEDGTVGMQDAGIDVEGTGSAAEEEEEVEDETQHESETGIPNLEGTAAELATESSEEPERTKPATEPEEGYAEETSSSGSACRDAIDEEILDLWIQAAAEKETGGAEQQDGPEPGRRLDTKPEHEEMRRSGSHSGESGLASDTEISLSTPESEVLDQSVGGWDTDHSETQPPKPAGAGPFQDLHGTVATSGSPDASELPRQQQPNSEPRDVSMGAELSDLTEEESSGASSEAEEETDEGRGGSAETETRSQKETDADAADPAGGTGRRDAEGADVGTLFKGEESEVEDEPLEEEPASGRPAGGSEASPQEEMPSTGSEDETSAASRQLLELPSEDKPQPGRSEDVAGRPTTDSEDQAEAEADASTLDFAAQRSRIAVKNPRVRPPTDPRALLHLPSAEPTPSSRLPVRLPAGVPLGGVGIGIKLPGLGAGFPVLKKTKRVVGEETSSETLSQDPEAKPEEKSDTPKKDEAQHKPKWMPPRHPGFGNPLMSELKTKLKKTTQD